jgi:four helix bundle protein
MKDVYDLTSNFPKREDFRLTSQLTGCAVSMPSNIAEGSARTDKAFSNFLDYSLGSSFELGTQLIAAQHAKYISEEQFNKINDKNNEFQRMTIGFMGKL